MRIWIINAGWFPALSPLSSQRSQISLPPPWKQGNKWIKKRKKRKHMPCIKGQFKEKESPVSCFVSAAGSWKVPASLCSWRLSASRWCFSTSGDKQRTTTMTLTGGLRNTRTFYCGHKKTLQQNTYVAHKHQCSLGPSTLRSPHYLCSVHSFSMLEY